MLKAQEIANSYINGNFRQFYEQVKEYGVYDYICILSNIVPYELFTQMVIKYHYLNEK